MRSGTLRKVVGAASVMLALAGHVRAAVDCPATQAKVVRIGAQTFAVEVAATPAQRERGLSERASLPEGGGMWFVLPGPGMHGFWMRGMRFPIDLIWVSPSGQVLDAVTLPICGGHFCPIHVPPAPVSQVLEVTAGSFAGKKGDTVHWHCAD